MATTVKKITLWRREIANQKGALAGALEPLGKNGSSLKILMAYAFPGSTHGAVECWPVEGKKAEDAARAAGLSPADIPCLLAEGDDAAGLGARFARTIADAGVNMDFLIATCVDGKYTAVFGFGNEADAKKAEAALNKVVKS